ncbi:archaellum component FlaC [Novosphingobium sp. 1748]|uniref:hypothetical protein n=1 Tax=Novosphingobium sp. 1748 TaxID=2817760 RepID=UPI00285C99EB|nr:hypothetical protein [Novosphingobium sp. 1748]MDR6708154.1 archaellum component FlaC [Novosphingobium sp. 1748]
MRGDGYELAIILFILLGIGWVVWKGGAANPEGTGTLGRRVNGISNKVSALSTRIEHIESDIEEIKHDAVTGRDVERIEGLLATARAEMGALRVEIAGDRKMAERTQHSLDRIERLILERGFGK